MTLAKVHQAQIFIDLLYIHTYISIYIEPKHFIDFFIKILFIYSINSNFNSVYIRYQ